MEDVFDLRVNVESHVQSTAKELGIEYREAKKMYDLLWADFGKVMATEEMPKITITNLGVFRVDLRTLLRKAVNFRTKGYLDNYTRLIQIAKRMTVERRLRSTKQIKNYKDKINGRS